MKRTLIIVIMAMLLVSSVAFAQRGQGGGRFDNRGDCDAPRMGMGGGHGQGHGQMFMLRFSDELGLEQGQIDKFKQMSETFALERIDRRAELQKAKVQLRSLKMNDASENEVMNMMDKIGKLETDMEKMRYKHHQAMLSVLTEEQQAKLAELQDDRPGGGRFPDCDGERKFDGSGNDRPGFKGRGQGR